MEYKQWSMALDKTCYSDLYTLLVNFSCVHKFAGRHLKLHTWDIFADQCVDPSSISLDNFLHHLRNLSGPHLL